MLNNLILKFVLDFAAKGIAAIGVALASKGYVDSSAVTELTGAATAIVGIGANSVLNWITGHALKKTTATAVINADNVRMIAPKVGVVPISNPITSSNRHPDER